MRIAVKFGYNGIAFHGYQRQKNVRTVEGEIYKWLIEKGLMERKSGFRSASRTDAGVSALGNVIAFNTPERTDKILRMLNTLSEDIWFFGYAAVENGFNPRHAKERWYRYILSKHLCASQKKIKDALEMFEGKHNFLNFARPCERNTTREIYRIECRDAGDFLFIDLYGSSFLWGMVRKIIGAAILYACNKISKEEIADALSCKTHFDFPMADPRFLILMDVKYGFEFTVSNAIKNQLNKKIERVFGTLVVHEQLYSGLKRLIFEGAVPESKHDAEK
ncbi:MAG: tRNA pseudouridine(38-40) synthase TruA [Thermoplasmata archaeon]